MAYRVSELKQIVRHALVHDPTLFALVDGTVFDHHGRDSEEATRKKPSVVFSFRGGNEFSSSPVARRTFFLFGYSNESQDEATRIYEAAADVLRRGGGLPAPPDESGDPCFPSCGYFYEGDGLREDYNGDVNAYFARGTWVAWQIG